MDQLVLSLFPGIGLLDLAFDESGFTVVRGPDVLWGGNIKTFHPMRNRFDGIIGGPPCQSGSVLRHIVEHNGNRIAENLTPEFERCIVEASPSWFLMETVSGNTAPVVDGYSVVSFLMNNRWVGGVQNRKRRFSFGMLGDRVIDLRDFIQPVALEPIDKRPTVCSSGGYNENNKTPDGKVSTALGNHGSFSNKIVRQSCIDQGLSANFLDESPFTVEGKQKVIGNGVPLPMGRAIAVSIVTALNLK